MGKKTKKDKVYLQLAAQIPCIVCMNEGLGKSPAQLHHPRDHTGGSLKESDRDVIALCPLHHMACPADCGQVAFHQGSETFEKRYGTQKELLVQMREEVEKLLEMYI